MPDDAAAFDFYPCLVDGAPASIYVDLQYEGAPPAGASTRYEITVRLTEAGPHGIGTAAESAALDELETAVLARAAVLGLVFAGRLRHRGTWEIVLYGPPGHDLALTVAARAHAAGRQVEVQAADDPAWRSYHDLLLPDGERRRWMDDRRIVQILAAQGDPLRPPRPVDHHARFATAAARDAYAQAAIAAGFTAGRMAESDDAAHPFRIDVTRPDPVELEHIHDVVMVLVDAAAAHGGVYGGWTAGLVG